MCDLECKGFKTSQLLLEGKGLTLSGPSSCPVEWKTWTSCLLKVISDLKERSVLGAWLTDEHVSYDSVGQALGRGEAEGRLDS